MTISLAVMNQSTAVGDDGVQSLMPALTQQWNADLRQFWPLDDVAMTFVDLKAGAVPDTADWWCVFLDDATQAGALALHDLTAAGLPLAKVFCKTIIAANESISVATSHELCEMAVDPWLNGAYQDSNGRFWAAEICDPCEDTQYAYDIGGVQVSDFITRNWFARSTTTGPIDFKGHVQTPFQVLSGGYAQVFSGLHGWKQITGDDRTHHAMTVPHGSRRDKRMRQYHDGALRVSRPEWIND